MTINTANRLAGPFTGNGITTAFPFSFKVFAAADLQVVSTTGGVDTTLALTTDYTVSLNSDQNSNPGGTVTLLSALATGSTLVITSSLAYLQQTDLPNQGGFYPAVITNALDRLTIFVQQLAGSIKRGLTAPVSDGNVDLTLPGAALRATKVLAFDSSGLPTPSNLSLASIESGAVSAAGSAADAADSAASAADSFSSFRGIYYGPLTSDPALDPLGNAVSLGDFYFNTASQLLRVYTSTSWVNAVTAAPVSFTQQLLSGTGAQTAFTLATTPASTTSFLVFIGGVVQRLTTDYTISGNTLTFTSAPAAGTNNIAVIIYAPVNVGVPSDSSVSTAKLADNAVTTVKLADDSVTAAKIAAGAVGASEIADGSIGLVELTVALQNLLAQATEANQGTATVATAAEAVAMSSDTDMLTPLKLKAAFQTTNQQLSANGFQKFPGGLIVQWGTYTANGSGKTVTFPVAFPTVAAVIVGVIVGTNATANVAVTSRSTTSFSGDDNASGRADWIAIGY